MQGKIKFVILVMILMAAASSSTVYGYTGKGISNDPYVVCKETELKEIFTQKSNGNSWVYVAVNGGITLTSTIAVDKGKFRVYAKGATRTIKRSSDLSAPINDKKDPKYCMKVMGNAQIVFGYKATNYILKLGGNKDNIAASNKTSGWLNINSSAAVTIGENCYVLNIRNNESSDTGAPIRTEGKLTVNGEIGHCIGVNGGAIKALSGEVIVNQTAKIHDCESQTEGGAIHVSSGGTITVNGGRIYECISKEEGGGIFITGNSRGEIKSGNIYSNVAGRSAGGIFSGYGATLIIGTTSGDGPDIHYNRASGSGGGVRCNGGVSDTAGGTTYFFGGSILHNYSGKNGGGIACGEPGDKGKSKIIIKNMNVIANVCESTGGGVWLPDGAEGINTDYVVLDQCVINANESLKGTGGIIVHCNVRATNNEINNNKCKSFGGGVFIDDSGCFTLYSGTISGNTCEQKGQGIYVQGELKILSDAYVEADNYVYLTKGTFIEVIGKLNKSSGYIAVIDSAVKQNGTKLVKAGYTGTDAIKELYYKGTPADEYIPKEVTKKYKCCGLSDSQCLRPGNQVTGYGDRWIIISEKYTISFEKNCDGNVDNMPKQQIKFWNENITISINKITKPGYETDEKKHWNTRADGKGTRIAPGGIYSLNENRKLYAIWIKIGISELLITAEDRYYVIGQNILLDNREILKKVLIEDDLKTGKKYPVEIIQIKEETGKTLAKGQALSADQYMNTNAVGRYEVTVYAREEDVEKTCVFRVYVLDTLLQNGKTRFISNLYLNTLSASSKWFTNLNEQLRNSIGKTKGEGLYTIHLTEEKIDQIKQKVKSNGYKINEAMNRELAESW